MFYKNNKRAILVGLLVTGLFLGGAVYAWRLSTAKISTEEQIHRASPAVETLKKPSVIREDIQILRRHQ
jgi:hypothetical protein